MSITLNAGTYSAVAPLLDEVKSPRTTTVTIPTFTLVGNDELIREVTSLNDSFR